MAKDSLGPNTKFVKRRAPALYVIIATKFLKGALLVALAIVVYALSDNDLPGQRPAPDRKFQDGPGGDDWKSDRGEGALGRRRHFDLQPWKALLGRLGGLAPIGNRHFSS